MISFAEAFEIVMRVIQPLPSRDIALQKAVGRYLTESIVAPISLPRFDQSAVDGYGLRVNDFAEANKANIIRLSPIGSIRAGTHSVEPLPMRGVVKLMTGAPIPQGVDSVIMSEEVETEGGIFLIRPPIAGENIRYASEEIKVGDTLIPATSRLNPAMIGLLATLGQSHVIVVNKPRIAIFSSGDELVSLGQFLTSAAQIYDSNQPMLTTFLSTLHISPSLAFTLPDVRLPPSFGQLLVLFKVDFAGLAR